MKGHTMTRKALVLYLAIVCAAALATSSHAAKWCGTTCEFVGFGNSAAVSQAIANVSANVGVVYDANGQTNDIQIWNYGTLLYTGPVDVSSTLQRIRDNDCLWLTESDDGGFFNFYPDELPNIPRMGNNYYMEFMVWPFMDLTDGTYDTVSEAYGSMVYPGAMRLLIGLGGEVYFTGDHYGEDGNPRNAYYVNPLPGAASGDSWVNTASDKWEAGPNWSYGYAPSSGDPADLITNANTKTVTIDAATVLNNAENVATNPVIGCMTIYNLTVSAPPGSINTLALTNAGTATPLQVLSSLTLDTNGALVVNNSAIVATNGQLFVGNTGGSAVLTITNGGSVAATNVVVGFANSASNNVLIVSGANLFVNGPLVVSQAGGTGTLTFNGGTITVNQLVLTNGGYSVFTFNAGTLTSGGTWVTNNQVFAVGDGTDPSTFQLNGGVHNFANNLEIRSNAFLTGCGTINGNVVVDSGGTVLANCGTLTFMGIVTNNATIQVINGSVLEGYGPVVNNGLIVICNGNTNFHSAFVNNGTILTVPTAGNNGPICAGGTLTLSTPTVAGATYSWTGPNSFSSTQQNPSIANATTAASGTYNVTVTVNACTSAAGSTIATVNAVPGTPGPISQGNPTGSSVCANASGVTYTISSVGGATSYTWSVPAGASITAGQGTTSITVTWGTTGGNVTVTANNTCGSGFAASLAVSLVTYTISTSSSPVGGGSTGGGGTVNCGSNVTVTATPNSCYNFVNWMDQNSNVVSTLASYSFTASASETLVANFSQITYTISTSSSPPGGGSTSGGGTVNCGSNAMVCATANSGYVFANWTLNSSVVSASNCYTFTPSANENLVANFAPFQITALTLQGSNVLVNWIAPQGSTNAVQATSGGTGGSYSTNFLPVSPLIVLPGANPASGFSTNYLDIGGATNTPARYYRIAIGNVTGVVVTQSFDNTAQPAYSGGWTNGSNGGTGFGPWTLTTTIANVNSNGFFIGSSTNNALGTSPGIDVSGNSWGVYANSGAAAAAYRSFSNSVPVGGTFKIDMDNGFIGSDDSDGFVLRTGNATNDPGAYNTNARFEFLYIGNDPINSYKVVDNAGLYNIGVGFTGTGLHLIFTLTSKDTYTLLVIDNASGNTNATVNGTLGGTPGNTLDSLALYNRSAGSGSQYDCFFNSLQIVGP